MFDEEENPCKKVRLLARFLEDEVCVADVWQLTFPNGTVDFDTFREFYSGSHLKGSVDDMVRQAEKCSDRAQRFADKNKAFKMASKYLAK